MNKVVYINKSSEFFYYGKIYSFVKESERCYLVNETETGERVWMFKPNGLLLEKWREQRINKILEE